MVQHLNEGEMALFGVPRLSAFKMYLTPPTLSERRCYNSYNPIKTNYSMEALKIAITCVIAAVLYGIVHDQITARICIEYFTVFHPPIFHTQSPTLLGIGWGIVATWW